jgi:hypothetical protein
MNMTNDSSQNSKGLTAKFGKSATFLICRIGTLVPVIILQVGILVP